MTDVLLILLLVGVVVFALCYIRRAKKRGNACIGCPHAKECGGHCGGNEKP